MHCQFCNCLDSKVIDSRPAEDGTSIRRRRECCNCGRRFTTYEKLDQLPLMVVKRDGRREPYNAAKVRTGILHACEKLPVSASQMEGVAVRVDQAAYASGDGEVTSQHIGDMIMEELKHVNDVAYVRFAAVYRKFNNVETFMSELQKLVDEKQAKHAK